LTRMNVEVNNKVMIGGPEFKLTAISCYR